MLSLCCAARVTGSDRGLLRQGMRHEDRAPWAGAREIKCKPGNSDPENTLSSPLREG